MSNLGSVVKQATAELAARRQREKFFNDPSAWAEYMLGVRLWSKQREVCNSLADNKSVAVKAGHGVGKSYLSAILICWWIDTRYPNVYVATTAPSTAQINAIVWREVRRMKADVAKRYKEGKIDHDLPGYITADAQWKDDDSNLLGFGRKPPENKEDSAFQGLHDGYVLAIGDEACGLSGEIIGALGNITSNANSRRLLIANPTNPASYFATLFEGDKGWKLQTISVLDNPNFTDEGKTMSADALSKLSDQSYVDAMAQEYGENSARFKSRVLGEFAFDIENTLFTPEVIEKGHQTEIEPVGAEAPRLGVDVARMGKDSTAIYMYHEGRVRFVDEWVKAPATESMNRVDRWARELGVCEVRVDASGMGGPMVDQLALLSDGLYRVVEMVGNRRSPDNRRWLNGRAWWWDNVRKRMSDGELDIDPEDTKLADEVLSVQYLFANTGGLQIESKESMAKRGVKSPNRADAMIYAAADFGVDFDDPLAQLSPGDRIKLGAADILGDLPLMYELMGRYL